MTLYSNKPYIFDFDAEYEFIGIGQIADPQTFKKACVANYGDIKGTDSKGWGERYKVRLCFRNSKDTPADQLIDAIRQMTFPSGHAALQLYIPLAPNTFVNIHKSRFNKQYYITSVIGNTLCSFSESKNPIEGCAPRSGFGAGLGGFTVPSTHIDGSKVVNEPGAGAPCKISEADKQLQELNEYINVPSACKPFDSNAINRDLINLKKSIESLRNKINGPNSVLSNTENFLNQANQIINQYAEKITGHIKWLINYIKERVEKGVNWAVNKAKSALYLNQRFVLQEQKTTALDLIACLFNKILDNLTSLITQFLNQIINRYVNMATCAIEKFLNELFGQIIGQILGAVNSIISSVLSTISGVKGLVDSILNSIISLLDFLSCEVKAECPDVTEWNFLEGAAPSKLSLNLDSIFESAKSIISSTKSIIDPKNFRLNLDLNSLIVGVNDICNVGPILCGPPRVSFWGGGGQGATGNAIISSSGSILGVDITSSGFGYSQSPFITFEDPCGRGTGATGIVIIGDVPYQPPNNDDTSDNTAGDFVDRPNPGDIVSGIVDVIILDNGTEYLPKSDGSFGGDGRTWADRCQSKIKRADGTWDTPYNPGEVIDVEIGDYVHLAGQTPYTSTSKFSITATECPPEDVFGISPSDSEGSYPVVLEMTDAVIVNPGFGYTSGDQIIVNPSNGIVLTPEFGYNGQLIKINIEKIGIGFTESPEIGIDSNTGHNVIIKPVFKVISGNQLVTKQNSGVGIINVVDCVGKPNE